MLQKRKRLGSSPSSGASNCSTLKLGILLATVAVPVVVYCSVSVSLFKYGFVQPGVNSEDVYFSATVIPSKSLGRRIVEEAYNASFVDLVTGCDLSEKGMTLRQCMSSLYELGRNPASPYGTKWPWWFQTLIRDAKQGGTGLFGAWHILQFPDPLMQLCVYEKGGTKMWRRVHCNVLKGTANITGTTLTTCYTRQDALRPNAAKAVFLRDPLERFLSGFLDKCASKNREAEQHCQPSIIFQSNLTGYVEDYLGETKKLFEIYVDTFPLKWDLHFYPLSLNCGGLYQNFKDYDFVGTMDDFFYQDLGRFMKRYPPLETHVRSIFNVSSNKQNDTNIGTEGQAAMQTLKYYTPNTVRRVLQYTSIDYMILGMTIPQWAEDLLVQDETFLK